MGAFRRVAVGLAGASWVLLLALGCGRIGYDATDPTPQGIASQDAGVEESHGGAGGTLRDSGIGDVSGAGGAGGTGGGTDADPTESGDGSAADATATCPSGISFSGATGTPLRGGSGGSQYTDACPAGQVVVGFMLVVHSTPPPAILGEIQVICGTISISPTNCEVAISSGDTLPLRGSRVDQPPVTEMCPPNQMVVAIQGGSGNYLDRAGAGCAPLMISRVGQGSRATVGAITWLSVVGGMGGVAFNDPCPADQVASGAFIQSAIWVDAMNIICSAPAIAP